MEESIQFPRRRITDDAASGRSSATASGFDLVRFNRESAWSRIYATAILLSVSGALELVFVVSGEHSARLGLHLRNLWGPCALSLVVSFVVLGTHLNRANPRAAFYFQMIADLVNLTIGIWVATTGAAAITARMMYVLIIVPPNLISGAFWYSGNGRFDRLSSDFSCDHGWVARIVLSQRIGDCSDCGVDTRGQHGVRVRWPLCDGATGTFGLGVSVWSRAEPGHRGWCSWPRLSIHRPVRMICSNV